MRLRLKWHVSKEIWNEYKEIPNNNVAGTSWILLWNILTGEFATQTCLQGKFGEEIGSDQFGGCIMLHAPSPGANMVTGRIEYVEVRAIMVTSPRCHTVNMYSAPAVCHTQYNMIADR